MNDSFDYVIAGGGILGLSVAREILNAAPRAKIAILEKEEASGHTSSIDIWGSAGRQAPADSLHGDEPSTDSHVAGSTFIRRMKKEPSLPTAST